MWEINKNISVCAEFIRMERKHLYLNFFFIYILNSDHSWFLTNKRSLRKNCSLWSGFLFLYTPVEGLDTPTPTRIFFIFQLTFFNKWIYSVTKIHCVTNSILNSVLDEASYAGLPRKLFFKFPNWTCSAELLLNSKWKLLIWRNKLILS